MMTRRKFILGVLVIIVMSVMLFGYSSTLVCAARPDTSSPTLTRDVDNGDRQTRVFGTINVHVAEYSERGYACHATAVPDGKRWVIEQVSAEATLSPSQTPYAQIYVEGSTQANHFMSLTNKGAISEYVSMWDMNQFLKLRLVAGDRLCAQLSRSAPVADAYLDISFTGYEVDAP